QEERVDREQPVRPPGVRERAEQRREVVAVDDGGGRTARVEERAALHPVSRELDPREQVGGVLEAEEEPHLHGEPYCEKRCDEHGCDSARNRRSLLRDHLVHAVRRRREEAAKSAASRATARAWRTYISTDIQGPFVMCRY